MGRTALGVFRTAPLGIVMVESGLTPARALLNRHQAMLAQRLHARPKEGQGLEEILTREGAAIARASGRRPLFAQEIRLRPRNGAPDGFFPDE